MRIFKRNCYVSTDDGMGFRRNDFYRPNEKIKFKYLSFGIHAR